MEDERQEIEDIALDDFDGVSTVVKVAVIAVLVAFSMFVSTVIKAEVNITSNSEGDVLTSASITLTWEPVDNVDTYWVYLGSTAGGSEYYTSSQDGGAFTATTFTYDGLPTDSSQLYVTIWSSVAGVGWVTNEISLISWDGVNTGGGTDGITGEVSLSQDDRLRLDSIEETNSYILDLILYSGIMFSLFMGWRAGSTR